MAKNPYANLPEEIVEALRKLKLSVLDDFSYDPKVRNYGQDIQRIKRVNPEAIVVIGFRESAEVLKEMINQGLGPASKKVYFSGSSMTNFLVRDLAPNSSPQDLTVLARVKGTRPTENTIFDNRLKAAYSDLNRLDYAAQAYDAVIITALAAAAAETDKNSDIAQKVNSVTRAGGQKCETFSDCMKLIKDQKPFSYVGPSGPLNFTNSGEPRSGTFAISQINSDGTIKVIENVTITY